MLANSDGFQNHRYGEGLYLIKKAIFPVHPVAGF
jgi:hypothetical protein